MRSGLINALVKIELSKRIEENIEKNILILNNFYLRSR